MLLHQNCVEKLLPNLSKALTDSGVQIRIEKNLKPLCSASDKIVVANEADFDTEFLDLIIAIKSVSSLNEAIEHVNIHGCMSFVDS